MAASVTAFFVRGESSQKKLCAARLIADRTLLQRSIEFWRLTHDAPQSAAHEGQPDDLPHH